MGYHAVDMTGQRVGRPLVIKRAYAPPDSRRSHAYWLCRCECGTEKVVSRNDLRNGRKRSCGCLRRDMDKRRVFGRPKREWWPG